MKAMPELSKCGISVKLGDMGVCVNPAGLDAGDNVGVKRFAPECNNPSEKKLTEKVSNALIYSILIIHLSYVHVLMNYCMPSIYVRVYLGIYMYALFT